MRAMRKASNKSLRQVARVIGLSPAYVSDLELGRRGWADSLVERYKKAVQR